jgi:hypothetical protein
MATSGFNNPLCGQVRYQGRPRSPQARTIHSSESRTGEANRPVARGFPCLSVPLNHSCLSPTHHNTTPPKRSTKQQKKVCRCYVSMIASGRGRHLVAGWQRTAPAAHFGPTPDPRSTPCLCLQSTFRRRSTNTYGTVLSAPLRRQIRFCLRVRAWCMFLTVAFCSSSSGLCASENPIATQVNLPLSD